MANRVGEQIGFILAGVEGAENGTIECYEAGTSNTKNVYTDRALSAGTTTVINLDSRGNISGSTVYYGSGLFKFVIKDSDGTTLYTKDDVGVGLHDGYWIDAADYADLSAAIGAISTTNADLIIDQALANGNTTVTVPTNVRLVFTRAGSITMNGGSDVLNINGQINPINHQIFTGSQIGSVAFGTEWTGSINPLWFGVVADWTSASNGTDNTTALQTVFDATPSYGTIEFPQSLQKGIRFNSTVTLGGHGKQVKGNMVVLKYSGGSTGFSVGGDKTLLNDIIGIGNANTTALFHCTNNNVALWEKVYCFGTGGIAFDLEGGPNTGTFIHCGVDNNMSVANTTLINSGNWGGNPDVGFKLREHTASQQEPNACVFIDCQVTNATGTTTGIGWDISSGSRVTLINPVLQHMATGIKVYDGSYASGQKPNKINLVNPWFETGTITLNVDDEFDGDNTDDNGVGVDVLGGIVFQLKNSGTGNYLYQRATSTGSPAYWVEDIQSTANTGFAFRGDSAKGVGVHGRLTGAGGMVEDQNVAGVLGEVVGTGPGIRGKGNDTPTSYAGWFENGLLHATSWNPFSQTVSTATTLTAVRDHTVFVTSNVTVTLPSATTCPNKVIYIKRNTAAGAVVVASGGGNIDGAGTKSLDTNYAMIGVQSDGTNWFIISQLGTVS